MFVKATRGILACQLLLLGTALSPYMVLAPVPAKVSQGSASPVNEENINGKNFLIVRSIVNARPDQVWQVLTDYVNSIRVFPILKRSQVLQDQGPTKIVRQIIAPTGLSTTYDYVVKVRENAQRSIEWHRIKGAFKEIDGFWKLEPQENGKSTMVTYASYIKGGFLMPQPLIENQCKIDVPATIQALKSYVEASTQIASKRVDNHKAQ